MMFTTLISAATLALGPCNATGCNNNEISSPKIIEIIPGMVAPNEVDRRQIRFSDDTQGRVIGEVQQDGQIAWPSSHRQRLNGQNAAERILVRMFDGTFSIDPFQPLPNADDSTAKLLFRGTSLETDRTQHGRQQIDRTKELFRKLEAARINWLRSNGFYGVRNFTNPNAGMREEAKLPEPSAVFERPADVPRGKSREQVNAGNADMLSVASVMNQGEEIVRVSLPLHMQTQHVARMIQRNGSDTPEKHEEVTINE